MKNENVIEWIPYWKDLSEAERQMAIQGSVIRTYRREEWIHGFSDACLGMIYVLQGSVRVFMTSSGGRDVTLFHIREGDSCILSASCIIREISFEVSLIAETATELLAIHSGTFQELMEKNLAIKCFAYELSTARFSTVVWVMQQILFMHFDERMARLLLSVYEKTGEQTIRMTQEAIAQEVNSAREVVTRMLRQFEEEGWISLARGVVTIKDPAALQALLREL